MDFDVDAHTIFLGLTGSHAYGTAHPGSDVDVRGCCVAPLRVRLSFRSHFEQLTWMPGPDAADQEPPLGVVFQQALARASTHASAGRSRGGAEAPPDVVIFDRAKLVMPSRSCGAVVSPLR